MGSDEAHKIFAEGARLRDLGELVQAAVVFQECLALLGEDDGRLRSGVYTQLAYIEDLMADRAPDHATRVAHLEGVVKNASCGVEANASAELPSIGLYIALVKLGRPKEALQEAIRFLQCKPSDEYRELLAARHLEERDPEIAELARTARELLQGHARRTSRQS